MAALQTVLVTFNCGRTLLRAEVFALYLAAQLVSRPGPDLLVLSLQEIAPIAHAFLGGSFLAPFLLAFHHAVKLLATEWGLPVYSHVLSRHVGMTALIVFAQPATETRIRWIEQAATGVGWLQMGNKGAVGIRLGLETEASADDLLELTFLAAHLAPGENAWKRRNEDWHNIVSRAIFTRTTAITQRSRHSSGDLSEELQPLVNPSSDVGVSQSGLYKPTAHLLVAGDLNYRTADAGPSSVDSRLFTEVLDEDDVDVRAQLFKRDQLRREMDAGHTLQGLLEADIGFAPTYKYSPTARKIAQATEDASTDAHELEVRLTDRADAFAAHRWPSWCDRILRLGPPPWLPSGDSSSKIEVNSYASLPLMSTSDHRPVLLEATIPGTPIRDPRPEDFLSDSHDPRVRPPSLPDPHWHRKRWLARRCEIAVGAAAYLALTWEGNMILLAVTIGSLGGWYTLTSIIRQD